MLKMRKLNLFSFSGIFIHLRKKIKIDTFFIK